jgi:hypothetical protein
VLLRLILFDGMRPAIIGLAIESAASAGILPLLRASHRLPGSYPKTGINVRVGDYSGVEGC